MNKIKKLARGFGLGALVALIGLATAPVANGQNFADRSVFTESTPFEVGGTRLEAGTYLIRIVLLASNRSVIQVTDTEQKTIYASVLAVPHPIRPDHVVSGAQYTFYPPVAGHVRALRTWFSRDARLGHDIAYPKGRAMELAVVVKEPVLAVPDDVKEAEYETAEIQTVTPDGIPPTPLVEAQPPTRIAQARPADDLPRTATALPLFAALGLLSLGGALGLHLIRRF